MSIVLGYSNNFSQRFFGKDSIKIGGRLNVELNVGTAAGGEKPNEDSFAINATPNAINAAVFDGVTSKKPFSAISPLTGARFASCFLKDQLERIGQTFTPKETILKLNSLLLDEVTKLGGSLKDSLSLPSSTATIIKIIPDKNILQLAHVGDSFCIVYFKGGYSQLMTDDKNKQFDEHMFEFMRKLAKERGITAVEASKLDAYKQESIKVALNKNNNPNGKGTGVINGDPNIKLYIQDVSISLDNIEAVLLGTDGLVPVGWSVENEKDRQKLKGEIEKNGMEQLIKIVRKAEEKDPDWEFTRAKQSDDATGVFIKFCYNLI